MAVLRFSSTLRTTRADAITTAVGNAGLWRIYDGSQPAMGGAATTLLAELTCGTPFAAGAAAGVLTIGNVTADASANAGAPTTATWARITTSGGTAVIDMDVSATGGGGALQLTTTSIVAGQPVSINNGATITEGNA
jgi:hypothetical protein